MRLISLRSLLCLIVLGSSTIAHADSIFTENFNGYTTGSTDAQNDTGTTVGNSGTLSGWSASGTNVIHAVEVNTGNWAAMIYADNVLTLNAPIATSNTAGALYSLSFNYGTACYQNEGQCTTADDSLLIQLIDLNSNVVAEETVQPGVWGSGNYNLDAGLGDTFQYTGTGSGDLILKISSDNPGTGAFAGSIDNLNLESAETPEPSSLALFATGIFSIGLAGIGRRRFFKA